MGNLYVIYNILSGKRVYYYNVGSFMYKYANQLLPDVFDYILPNLQRFTKMISEIHPFKMFMYVSKEKLGDKNKLLWYSRLELTRTVQLDYMRNTYIKLVIVFKWWCFQNSAILNAWKHQRLLCYVYRYLCQMRYICGYTCAWKRVCSSTARFLLSTPKTIFSA